MNYSPSPVLTLRLPEWRVRLVAGVILLWFAGLAARSLYLQALNNDFLRAKGAARYSRVIEISAHRGMITDRWGKPLAISTPVESVWASPQDVDANRAQLTQLSKLLDMPISEIKSRLADTKRDFVYLKRRMPPEEADKVIALDVPGVFLQGEYRRYYPAGEVTAHVLGFTGVDDNGQEGLELAYQNWLAGSPGSKRVIKDRLGHIIEDVGSIKTPQEGRDLTLSIDRNIQYLAFRELSDAVVANKAKDGSIVVLDAKTGEVLAMASYPSYNPNNRDKVMGGRTRNRAVTDTYEPGSTLKPFTIAAALEAGKITPDTRIDTAPGYLKIGKWTIHDDHKETLLTVPQIIQVSSNVGAAKIALSMTPEMQWNMLRRVGFGMPPGSGFPGEASGKLRPYQDLRPINQATMAYGNGISVSLLQLARAYTIFADDGVLMPVTFLKRNEPVTGARVISAVTAKEVRRMLELVVQQGGTAPLAQIVGYRVAGKTGTAHKLDPQTGRYSPDRYVASFVGMAPASNPRIIIAVMIDEPGGKTYYGGTVAAPVFHNVMAGILRMMSISPDAPLTNVSAPPAKADAVRETT